MSDLAIVSAAVKLPGAETVADFWSSILAQESAFKTHTDDELMELGVPKETRENDRFVPTSSFLESANRINLEAFGLSAGEAAQIDPQHRLVLRLGQEVIQGSGLDPASSVIGAYVSTTASSYLHTHILPNRGFDVRSVHYPTMLGNNQDFAATRLAHKLGLRGAAISVQTACSSSLVAVHQAALALRSGAIDAAIVAAASITMPQRGGYIYPDGGVLSPTGVCRPFDSTADGTIKGNGGGAVMLMRLEDALADDRDIIAVIRGVAVNNDGADKMGFAAPSIDGQSSVISAALKQAEMDPKSVGYVETHGTGTNLGDPIELRALHRAHGKLKDSACYLGSTKATHGHLDSSAGVVGLIKAALVSKTGIVPAMANFTEANPELKIGRTRFVVPQENITLAEGSRAVAVSSFGMGGTNAHAIVESLQIGDREGDSAESTVTIVADSGALSLEYRRRIAEHLEMDPTITVSDVAATLNSRNESGDTVWSARVRNRSELIALLRDPHAESSGHQSEPTSGRVSWLPVQPKLETVVDLPDPAKSVQEADEPQSAADGEHRTVESVNRKIMDLFRQHLGKEDISGSEDFFDLGGESMMLVDIVSDTGDFFRTKMSFDDLDGMTIISELADVLVSQIEVDEESTAKRKTDAPKLIRLDTPDYSPIYLYPPAGGTNFCYLDLHRTVPEIPIVAFGASPERDGQKDIQEIARRSIAQIPTGSRNLRVGGYSFGGNVAIEMALQLEQRGDTVSEVVLFDAHVPTSYLGEGISDSQYDEALTALVANATGDDKVDLLAARANLGADAESTLIDDFLQLWKSNHQALTRHRPQGKTAARITVFRAVEPHPKEELELLGMREVDKQDWAEYTTGELRIVDVPGNHYTMFTDPEKRAELARQWRDLFSTSTLALSS